MLCAVQLFANFLFGPSFLVKEDKAGFIYFNFYVSFGFSRCQKSFVSSGMTLIQMYHNHLESLVMKHDPGENVVLDGPHKTTRVY